MTERHQVTYRALRLEGNPGAGARLRERQHELKRVFRFSEQFLTERLQQYVAGIYAQDFRYSFL